MGADVIALAPLALLVATPPAPRSPPPPAALAWPVADEPQAVPPAPVVEAPAVPVEPPPPTIEIPRRTGNGLLIAGGVLFGTAAIVHGIGVGLATSCTDAVLEGRVYVESIHNGALSCMGTDWRHNPPKIETRVHAALGLQSVAGGLVLSSIVTAAVGAGRRARRDARTSMARTGRAWPSGYLHLGWIFVGASGPLLTIGGFLLDGAIACGVIDHVGEDPDDFAASEARCRKRSLARGSAAAYGGALLLGAGVSMVSYAVVHRREVLDLRARLGIGPLVGRGAIGIQLGGRL